MVRRIDKVVIAEPSIERCSISHPLILQTTRILEDTSQMLVAREEIDMIVRSIAENL